jgi:D-sedoheptulose 7-phosphate isomerase
MKDHVLHSLHEAKSALDNLLLNASANDAITRAGNALVDVFRNGNRVFSCGNGGSMCDAMHFAE